MPKVDLFAGGNYVSRVGHHCVIDSADHDSVFVFKGRAKLHGNIWAPQRWTAEGKTHPNENSDFDIVDKWVARPHARYRPFNDGELDMLMGRTVRVRRTGNLSLVIGLRRRESNEPRYIEVGRERAYSVDLFLDVFDVLTDTGWARGGVYEKSFAQVVAAMD